VKGKDIQADDVIVPRKGAVPVRVIERLHQRRGWVYFTYAYRVCDAVTGLSAWYREDLPPVGRVHVNRECGTVGDGGYANV
jgi:hypothetical protein